MAEAEFCWGKEKLCPGLRPRRLPCPYKSTKASQGPKREEGGHAPTGLCGGIRLSRTLPMHVGEGSGIRQASRKRQGNWPKVNKDNVLSIYYEIVQ